jgi:hypothetical protein
MPVLWASVGDWRREDAATVLVETALTDRTSVFSRHESAFHQLSAYVRDQPVLLVLDGYQPAEIRSEAVIALLHECRALRVVVTSRVAPVIAGRWLLPLGPLAVPENDLDLDAPAVRLLVRHIRQTSPEFVVTAANATAVAELCRRLDGIPVALVALASWFLFDEPQALLTAVRADPFDVIPDLRELLSRTVDQLDEGEHRLLDGLARHGGCWAVPEAAMFATLSIVDCTRMLRHLTGLGVIRSITGGGHARFRALELVRFLLARSVPAQPAALHRSIRKASFTIETAALLPG